MTLEAATAPPQAQTQQATAFQHPRLGELLKRAGNSGGVGAVLMQIIHDLVHPQDTVLCCFYSMEVGGGATMSAADANNFYAIDVVLVTSAYYINIGLFPKTHNYRKRKIHTIADVQIKYDPPAMDELRNVQPGKFSPGNVNLTVVFADERGSVVETWAIESTHPEQVRHLHDIARITSRCVGFPLSKIGGAGAAGGS